MKALRILVVLVVLIAAGGMIAVNVWGAQMSLWMNGQTPQNEAFLTSGEPQTPRAFPANPLFFFQNRGELRDVFATDALNDTRTVVITTVIPAQDLLAPGEPMPEATRLPLYAAARAPAQMVSYCAEVVMNFGRACDVIRTSTRLLDDGRVEISADLAYIPAATLGDPQRSSGAEFFTASAALYDLPTAQQPTFDAASRTLAMEKAQEICDAVRASFGNCVVVRLQLSTVELWITDLERLPAGTNPQRLEATAIFRIYANKADASDEGLHDFIQQRAIAG